MEDKTQKKDACSELNPTSKCKSLIIDGTKYRTLFTKKFEERVSWEKPNEKIIFSFIPGTINKIFVKKGQDVKKGSRLFTLEAMKMVNRIQAPFSGKIKDIYVEEGQKIPKSHLILEFE